MSTYRFDPKIWNGVEVSLQEADEFVEEGIRYLQKNPEVTHTYHATGHRAVFVFRTNAFGDEDMFEVYDCVVKRHDVATINDSGVIVNKFRKGE